MRFAATSAILTATLSRWDRAPTSLKADIGAVAGESRCDIGYRCSVSLGWRNERWSGNG
jgi:hypothetical protein